MSVARYFFHVTSEQRGRIFDAQGEEFSCPEAAISEGRQIALEISRDHAEAELGVGFLHVIDDNGAEIALFPIYWP